MFELDDLLLPLPGPDPCGPDLSYDPEFMQLEAAARGRNERRIGPWVTEAVPPDWQAVRRLSLSLFKRTKDLRVATYLVHAEVQLEGIGSLARGLHLIAGLIERYERSVHPVPDDDDRDRVAWYSALASLGSRETLLGDVLALRFGQPTRSLTGRDIVEVVEGARTIPSIDEVLLALREEAERAPGLLKQLEGACEALNAIENSLQFLWVVDIRPLWRVIALLRDNVRIALAGEATTAPTEARAPAIIRPAPPADAPLAAGRYAHLSPADLFFARAHREGLRALLTPISTDEPCGPNLEYDPEFFALERAAQGGGYVDGSLMPLDPDWRVVLALSRELLARTKDLRVALLLLRASTRIVGIAGAAAGLQLIHALLETHWNDVHPTLDAEDNDDPTQRLNALLPLADTDAFLGDLRYISLGRPHVTGRSLELAYGDLRPKEFEAVDDDTTLRQALRAADEGCSELLRHAREAHDAAAAINATVAAHVGDATLDLKPLLDLLRRIVGGMERLLLIRDVPNPAATARPQHHEASETVSSNGDRGPSSQESLRVLELVWTWIEQGSSDAARDCRRARRLMIRRFTEAASDLAPDCAERIKDFMHGSDR